jgi:hypothetical protein
MIAQAVCVCLVGQDLDHAALRNRAAAACFHHAGQLALQGLQAGNTAPDSGKMFAGNGGRFMAATDPMVFELAKEGWQNKRVAGFFASVGIHPILMCNYFNPGGQIGKFLCRRLGIFRFLCAILGSRARSTNCLCAAPSPGIGHFIHAPDFIRKYPVLAPYSKYCLVAGVSNMPCSNITRGRWKHSP